MNNRTKYYEFEFGSKQLSNMFQFGFQAAREQSNKILYYVFEFGSKKLSNLFEFGLNLMISNTRALRQDCEGIATNAAI